MPTKFKRSAFVHPDSNKANTCWVLDDMKDCSFFSSVFIAAEVMLFNMFLHTKVCMNKMV